MIRMLPGGVGKKLKNEDRLGKIDRLVGHSAYDTDDPAMNITRGWRKRSNF